MGMDMGMHGCAHKLKLLAAATGCPGEEYLSSVKKAEANNIPPPSHNKCNSRGQNLFLNKCTSRYKTT